jgi:branched-chain amino acid transport system substrate-binding protein
MSRRGIVRLVAVLAVLSLVAAACKKNDNTAGSASSGAPVTKIPVTVYFQGAWTGPYNYLVIPSIQGAQLHAKEFNADPSFPATITVAEADTQGDPAQAPPVVQQAVSDPNTVAVAGPGFSGESRASGQDYNDAKIPFLTASATAVDLNSNGWDYWYRTVGNDDLQGGNDGVFLAKVVGAKKLFITNDKSDYGQPLSNIVKTTAQQNGVAIAGVEGIAPTDNYSSLISAIKASGADSVFYGGYDADFAKIVKQGKDAGLTINWMSGDGSCSSTFLSSAGTSADGVYLSIPSKLGGDFVTKYNTEYGGTASAVPVYAAEGYDVMGLIGEGIKTAVAGGASTPTDIRAGIKTYLDSLTTSNPYPGVAKPIAFTQPQHELDAADPNSLLYFYQVTDGAMKELGNAADVLGS